MAPGHEFPCPIRRYLLAWADLPMARKQLLTLIALAQAVPGPVRSAYPYEGVKHGWTRCPARIGSAREHYSCAVRRGTHHLPRAYAGQVVVNGEAIIGLSGSEPIDVGAGVSSWACERALQQRGLPPDGLRPGVGTVPSAVIALANAQHEGAAYIRI